MIIRESFKKTYNSRILKWFLLGSIGAINVILQIGKTYFDLTQESSVIIGVSISIGIFIIVFFLMPL